MRKDAEMEPEHTINVLLVDDQPSNLLALEAVLGGTGLNLVRARSGEEALLRVLEGDFAVILMDVQMPGLDGFETAALIRERDRSKHTPIIFLTAFSSSAQQVFQGYALGAVDYLSKPIIPAVLRSKVSVFVELHQKTEQVRRQADELRETQRREHERELGEQKRRWELDRLREEAAREKRSADEQTRRAEELARNIAERVRAEEQLRSRAAQQAIVAELGQRALVGTHLPALLDEAVAAATGNLGVRFGMVMELDPDAGAHIPRAGLGWRDGGPVRTRADAGTASLADFTLHANEAVIVEDLRHESRFEAGPFLEEHGIFSAMSVVVYGRDSPYGTLGVFHDGPRLFSRDDAHFLQAIANVLSAAIQRKRDEAELAAVRDELAVQLADMTRLHALSAQLSNTLELAEVLEEVLTAVSGLQGAQAGVLMLRDRERDEMFTAASVGFTPEQLAAAENSELDVPPGDRVTAVISGEIVVEDATGDPVLMPRLAAARLAGLHAVCTTPLLTGGGEMVGSIATYFPSVHHQSDRETRLVELYARQAAQFIDNARLYREIRESDRSKGEFLAMLAHELRNPLAPILNALYLLRHEGEGETIVQAREIAERQVRHMARLVDDLLDVSRISQGKIQLRKGHAELREAVAAAIEAARPLISARRHEVVVSLPDQPVHLEADTARLEQVLTNLLTNAGKYTEPGGRIEVSAGREGDDVFVRVRDNGIGIAPELLPRVFDLFTQADRSLDRSEGGLGIGLTLVRRLIELHGGSVTATSAGVGQGSEFTVRLPIGTPERYVAPVGARVPDSLDRARNTRPKRVLIVDDNVDGARIMARLLQANGHRPLVAHDGLSAIDLAREHTPDVVILDIGLPGMDGYQVAERLREMEGMGDALIVALTGYGQDEDRRRSREAGIDLHLVKPVSPEEIVRLLASDEPLMTQERTNAT
jgi:signal transduction histidine kinase/DNA-binding response OmpR family regulator